MIKKYSDKFFYDILSLEKKCFSDFWTEKMLKSETENENSKIYIYELNNSAAGYILLNICIDEGEIYRICVDENYRNQKIGTKLIEKVKTDFSHLKKINLEVKKSNMAAINLYKKCGFETVGLRKKYYKDNEDAVLMTCVNLSV